MNAKWLTFLSLAFLPTTVWGQNLVTSPVNRSQALQVIRGDFGLVDGAASAGNVLYVPDVKSKKLFAYRPNSDAQPWQLLAEDQGAFSGTFFQLGELFICDNPGGRILRSRDGKQLREWVKFETGIRPNDLVVDHAGNAYVTLTGPGEVRRIRADGSIETVLTDLQSPNGITLSPDNRTLYISLYKPGTVMQASIQGDEVGRPALFATIEPTDAGALADGMTVDRAGNVYCAAADSVWIWNPAGQLLDKIKTPERPINATFGGQQGDQLYISTFGGLVGQAMFTSGVPANPAMTGELANLPNKPSTEIGDSVRASLDQVYYQEGTRKLLCDIFVPNRDEAGQPAIVLVHGGGWLKGDKNKFRSLALRLAERGYVVMAIEYRLGFEAKFPAAIHDCNAATRYLRSNAASYNVDPDRIAAVGGSAGGHLVGLMATGYNVDALQPKGTVTYLEPTARSFSSRLKAAVVMAGPMQIATGSVADRSKSGSESNATHWLGKTIDEARELYVLADAYDKISRDDPPVLFITGTKDNPQRDEPSLQKFKSVGVTARQVLHQDATHGHWNRSDWMPRVVDDICEFLKEQL